MKKRLTVPLLDRLKPDPKKRIEVHDIAAPGLALRVSPSGKKSWTFMFRVAGEGPEGAKGKNTRMTFGTYPLLGLAEARAKAAEAQDQANRGINPSIKKSEDIQQRINSRTEGLIAKFIELQAKPNTKNWKSTQTLLNSTVGIKWAGRPVDTIKRAEIHHYLDELKEIYGPGKASEVRKHFSIFLNWCADREYLNANPMLGMKRNDLSYNPRERVLNMSELDTRINPDIASFFPVKKLI